MPSPEMQGGGGGVILKVKWTENETTVEFDDELKKRIGYEWRTLPVGEYEVDVQVGSS